MKTMAERLQRPGAWLGVDLDGTLAYDDGCIAEDHIGEPVPLMLQRVKDMLSAGYDVRIFTARVDGGLVALDMGLVDAHRYKDTDRITNVIQDWTEKHLGVRLPVTCKKDFGMVALYDDRAIQIIPNTGVRADGQP